MSKIVGQPSKNIQGDKRKVSPIFRFRNDRNQGGDEGNKLGYQVHYL